MASVCLEKVKKVDEGGAIAVQNMNFEVKNKEFDMSKAHFFDKTTGDAV